MSEFRLAFRVLAKSRAFSLITIAVLALGIGATTAVFTVVNGVLLRPLSYQKPQQLYLIREGVSVVSRLGFPWVPANPRHFQLWQQRCPAFADMAIGGVKPADLTDGGRAPRLVRMATVSARFFPLLGVRANLGRAFLASDDRAGHNDVVLLSHALWETRYGGDPHVIGRSVTIDGAPLTVVGVLPASFQWPFPKGQLFGSQTEVNQAPDLYKPLALDTSGVGLMSDFNYDVIARLAPGVRPAQALAQLDAVEQDVRRQAHTPIGLWAVLQPLQATMTGPVHAGLLLLLTAILAVLLIACFNLANLALARAAGRAREAAIRSALGASRRQLLWSVLAEHLLLAAIGGALGLLLAVGGVKALLAVAPAGLPRVRSVHIDLTVLAVAVGLTVLSGIFFGLLPAWRLSRTAPQETLQSGGRSLSDGPRARRVGNTVIGLEAAVTVVLLMVAGLLATSFMRLLRVPTGLDTSNVLTVNVRLPNSTYATPASIDRFFTDALTKIRALPGVERASMISALPVTGSSWFDVVAIPGDTHPPNEQPLAQYRFVSPGYFASLGIPLRQGRDFSSIDQAAQAPVGVISAAAASQLWHGRSPLGLTFKRGDGTTVRVVGVAGDVPTQLDQQASPTVYLPYWLESDRVTTLVVRTAMDPNAARTAVQQALWSLDPTIPVPRFLTMTQIIAGSVAERRFEMWLTLLFAGVALGLAALGLYGVISYWVTRRSGELGVRMALGASPAAVVKLVLREGLTPVGVGALIGLVAAIWAGRAIASLLFQVRADDPLTMVMVLVTLALVTTVACCLPAWRAARIDPKTALRSE